MAKGFAIIASSRLPEADDYPGFESVIGPDVFRGRTGVSRHAY